MLKNHLKVALRLIARQKSISAISVFGLSIGIAVSLFLLLFVTNELAYDSFHKNAKDIYRINVISYNTEADFYRTRAPAPLADLLSSTFPEVQSATKITRPRKFNFLIRGNDQEFYESDVYMSDEHFFGVFSFPLLFGNAENALTTPYKVILTEEMANKYFGRSNVVGQTLSYENNLSLEITGVLKDIPQNSSLQFDFIISNYTPGLLYQNWENDWGNSNANIYLRLHPGSDAQVTEAKFPAIVESHVSGLDEEERFVMSLQSLPSIHLNPHLAPEQVWAASNKKYVYFLPIIALFILIIASFNYVNLSLARATDRLKEVGVRKVMGASRKGLIWQFWTESVVLITIASVLAILSMAALLPSFNELASRNFYLADLLQPYFFISLLGLILFIAIISGIYPAVVLSGIKPIKAINQVLSSIGSGSTFTRNMFLSVQFAVTLILIVAAIMVHKQLNYIQQRSLGFDEEQVLYFFERDTSFWSQSESFKNELLGHPGISSVAFSAGIPGQVQYSGTAKFGGGKDPKEMMHIMVDHDFLSLYDFDLVDGRSFQKELKSDETAAYLINETAAEAIGWDDPIGQQMTLWGNQGSVIGIVKDFHFESMQNAIEPIAFHFGPKRYDAVSIKIRPEEMDRSIALIEQQWATQMPNKPFQYQFVEDQFATYYLEEQRFSKITDIATSLGLILAILGLFALTAFSINRRAKEIGIRRVLGATYSNVLALFLKKTLWLCVIALILSIPLAYLGIEQWLQSFAYRVDISWSNFLIAAVILAIIVVLTIGIQVFRFIFGDPANALRQE